MVEARQKRSWKRQVTALVSALAISLIVFLIGRYGGGILERFKGYGYPGVFLISLLGNATVILPAPSLAFVYAMGGALSPVWVGVCAGAGETIGELTGYLAGYGGRAFVEDREEYERIVAWTQRYGLWVVFVLAVVPSALFDLVGIAAGTMRVPLWKFLLICWVGKTIKTVIVAWLGHSSFQLWELWFRY